MSAPFPTRAHSAREHLDFRCYFVTGSGSHDEIVARAVAAARGGAGIIQVRSKPITEADLYRLAADVSVAVTQVNPNCAVLVDDVVELVAKLKTDGYPIAGVHVGQDDMNVAKVREILGPGAVIGLTTGTVELARAANAYAEELDYIGCGPFRATPTKDSGRSPLGISGYPPIVAASAVPVVAIGDVTIDDAQDLAATGVAGVAIVRGIMHAANPEEYVAGVVKNVTAGQAASRRAEQVEVNIIGAGMVGLATAVELAHHGHSVRVLDPSPASGATHHAGGMLAPAAEVVYQQDPLFPLMQYSGQWYPKLMEIVAEHTDLPTGYRTEGTLVVAADRADSQHLTELMDYQNAHGMDVAKLSVRQARKLEPALSPAVAGAVEIPGDHQIFPRQTALALLDALKNMGVEIIREQATKLEDGAVLTAQGRYPAKQTVLCNGLGARDIAGVLPETGTNPASPKEAFQLRPVYGEVLQLQCPEHLQPLCDRVIRGFVEDRPIYIIPRSDGRITIGATSREDHRSGPPASSVYDLLRDAIRLVPGIEECEFLEATTGARPGTPNDLPYLGRVSANLVISTGYFRHGILLSALAARVSRELIEGATPDQLSVDISACAPFRDAR
ncbi:glycine oxidase ThiO [Corynebacterium pseudodiphtheriticum]|nr:glycine oxidase ThiO [Corynebacterium pseudodiphtheriticum]